MKRVRFKLKIKQVGGDYRPVSWPIKYPYWCSGESSNNFVMVAYIDSIDDLMSLWPEAYDIESSEAEKVEFTDRFPKPDWYDKNPDTEEAE